MDGEASFEARDATLVAEHLERCEAPAHDSLRGFAVARPVEPAAHDPERRGLEPGLELEVEIVASPEQPPHEPARPPPDRTATR